MTIPVTIHLPDDLYQQAQRFARLANRDLSSIIADTFLSTLPPVGTHIDDLPAIDSLLDAEILTLANSQMDPDDDTRMSILLGKQRENQLLEDERQELKALMQNYQEGWLRKTTALVEAIQRGLMEPMDS